MSDGNEPVVVTENLTKRYGEFCALNDLTIHVDRGQILGFIGPNGAGKTTTIKILVGLSRPTSGLARIAGVNCSENASKIFKHAFVFPTRMRLHALHQLSVSVDNKTVRRDAVGVHSCDTKTFHKTRRNP